MLVDDALVGVGDDRDLVVAARRHEAVAAVGAVRRPVRLAAGVQQLVGEVVARDDRGVVRHRAGDAELAAVAAHRDPVVRGVQQVGLARQRPRPLRQRQRGDAQRLELLQVELDEAMKERQLQVGEALVGRQRHRPHGGAVAGKAVVGERLADVDAREDREAARVDDLEHAIALGCVERGRVERRVDRADAGVEDARAVGREVVLVRLVAGCELADDRAALRVDDVDLLRRRGRHEQPRAVRRDRHVVGAVALDLHAPDDRARAEVDRHDVGEARPPDVQEAAVGRREGVVDVLVVALADEQGVGLEDPERHRVGRDLGQPLRKVGHDVQPRQDLQRVRVDDVGRPVPVVADDEHVARRGSGGERRRRGASQRDDQRDGERRDRPCACVRRDHRAAIVTARSSGRATTAAPWSSGRATTAGPGSRAHTRRSRGRSGETRQSRGR